MRPALVIAAAALREHARRRLLAFFAAGSVLLTLGLVWVARGRTGRLFVPAPENVALLASLSILHFLALLAALATSMGNIGRPFASGEAAVVLARPIARWQWALGRYLGSAGAVAGLCALLAAETQVVQLVASGRLNGQLWGHWAVQAFNLCVVAGIATLFSVFLATPVLAGILAYVVNQAVGAVDLFHRLAQAGIIRGRLGTAAEVVWYATPKLLASPLVPGGGARATIGGRSLDLLATTTPGLVLWAAAYLAAMLALACLLTRRKEA